MKKFFILLLPLLLLVSTASTSEKNNSEKSISILAIGNSFSVDAMEFLYGFLQEAGYDEIHLGNLYIGGCSLQRHADNIATGEKAYTFYENTDGHWTSTCGVSAIEGMKAAKWDYVSTQQASNFSGMPDSYYPYLGQIITAVRKYCPDAGIMWHMTWAYQADSDHSSFPDYDRNQMTMYNAIINAVQTNIVTNDNIGLILPSGTTVQNLRTSYLGDTITRDGFHMSYDLGRYATAMTWAAAIAGLDVDGSTYLPKGQNITQEMVKAVKDAVKKAIEKPFEITESSVK